MIARKADDRFEGTIAVSRQRDKMWERLRQVEITFGGAGSGEIEAPRFADAKLHGGLAAQFEQHTVDHGPQLGVDRNDK